MNDIDVLKTYTGGHLHESVLVAIIEVGYDPDNLAIDPLARVYDTILQVFVIAKKDAEREARSALGRPGALAAPCGHRGGRLSSFAPNSPRTP